MPNNLSIIDDSSWVCASAVDRLASAGFPAEKFRHARAFMQARRLLLCFSLGDGQ